MRYLCAPAGHSVLRNARPTDHSVRLFAPRSRAAVTTTGGSLRKLVERLRLASAPLAWDLVSIALALNAVDNAAPRATSPDGWTRRLEAVIAVRDPVFWATQRSELERALRFLTTDIWTLEFIDGGDPFPGGRALYRPDEDCCCLLSGGLDSLAGLLTLVADGRRPCPVSQVAAGDKLHQREFARAAGAGESHIQLNHNVRSPVSERSQRSRSLVFLAYGVMAATSLAWWERGDNCDLVIPENGFIAINPPLTRQRLGALSTRTTHPSFLASIQSVLDAGRLRVTLINPFRYRTKGESLSNCPEAHQRTLRSLAPRSTSCGRFARNAFTHCGRCVPCLIRRASFRSWGRRDTTKYVYRKLATRDRSHAFFDDVRSLASACHLVATEGLTAWLGAPPDVLSRPDRGELLGVISRGVDELSDFLRAQGVR